MYQPRVEIPKKKIQSKVELQERINNREREREREREGEKERERERERENNHIF